MWKINVFQVHQMWRLLMHPQEELLVFSLWLICETKVSLINFWTSLFVIHSKNVLKPLLFSNIIIFIIFFFQKSFSEGLSSFKHYCTVWTIKINRINIRNYYNYFRIQSFNFFCKLETMRYWVWRKVLKIQFVQNLVLFKTNQNSKAVKSTKYLEVCIYFILFKIVRLRLIKTSNIYWTEIQ